MELKPKPKPNARQKSLKPSSRLTTAEEASSNFGKSKVMNIVLKTKLANVPLRYLRMKHSPHRLVKRWR